MDILPINLLIKSDVNVLMDFAFLHLFYRLPCLNWMLMALVVDIASGSFDSVKKIMDDYTTERC